jgi:hypothetical protein
MDLRRGCGRRGDGARDGRGVPVRFDNTVETDVEVRNTGLLMLTDVSRKAFECRGNEDDILT